jgi:signal transduction histidine kinase
MRGSTVALSTSESSAGAEPERPARQASRLKPREVLRYLAQVAELPVEARDDGALTAVVRSAVPALADEAALFVRASDGRLHRVARAARQDGDVRAEALENEELLPRDSSHLAVAAARVGTLAYREQGEKDGVAYTGEAPVAQDSAHARIEAVAVPILREREAVAALYLCVEDGKHYSVADLDLLVTVGRALSLALENARLRREARDARRAKADFLSVMSHELRTPLTAVVGYADLLEAGIPGPVNEGQVGHLGRIKESAWELLELIDGILGYARYEGERPELDIEVVRPEELVTDAVTVFRSSMREKGLELVVEPGHDLPAFRTDREKASRILLHLLSNAHKFTQRGEVRISVGHDPERILFSVQDTGAGIPPRDMEHIFEPFWQGQKPDTRTAGGAGMGLSLARRLSEMLSGELLVESRVGKGTTARLSLPREGPRPSFP